MKRSLVVVAFACLLSACGGSPTGPDPVPAPPVSTPSTPEPTAPPTVEPAPVPTPTPAPPAPKRWRAATDTEHWFGPALLSGHFEVSWTTDTLSADRYNAWPVLAVLERSILAGNRDATFTVVFTGPTTGTWTFNGVAGQAAGTLSYE